MENGILGQVVVQKHAQLAAALHTQDRAEIAARLGLNGGARAMQQLALVAPHARLGAGQDLDPLFGSGDRDFGIGHKWLHLCHRRIVHCVGSVAQLWDTPPKQIEVATDQEGSAQPGAAQEISSAESL
jgi:hypothetical protein